MGSCASSLQLKQNDKPQTHFTVLTPAEAIFFYLLQLLAGHHFINRLSSTNDRIKACLYFFQSASLANC